MADRASRTKQLDVASDKFMRLSGNVVRLQNHLEQQKNDALDAQNKAKDIALANQALKAEKDMAETSERRLREENEHLRKEAREKNALVDKLTDTDRAVEAGKRAELAALQEELTRMRRKAEDDRRAVAQAELEQTKQASQAREKTRELESKISALKARLVSPSPPWQTKAEGEKLTAAAAAAAASEKVAATKAVELSARLNEARARLVTGGGGGAGAGGGGAGSGGGVSGGGGLEDGMAGQLAEVGKLQMELESMRADLKAKTEALATSERQRGQYEAMAKSKQKHVEAL
ncbi:unnamed protein product, partial [Ectocarpus sp. 12 AP-2014]